MTMHANICAQNFISLILLSRNALATLGSHRCSIKHVRIHMYIYINIHTYTSIHICTYVYYITTNMPPQVLQVLIHMKGRLSF